MDLSSLTVPFSQVAVDYYACARNAAAAGRKVAGYMCSYAPQELLYAAGYLPVRVLGRSGDTHRADELLQAFSCSFARSALDSALEGEWSFLDLMMFSHTCDTMQNVADLWRAHTPNAHTLIVAVPSRTDSEAALRYYTAELERVRAAIEEVAGPIADDKIVAAMMLYREHEKAMQRLFSLRSKFPETVTGTLTSTVTLAAFLMDRADHLEHLNALLAHIEEQQPEGASSAPRVFVAGGMCRHVGFIELMEQAGCRVVGDDLCVGARSFAHIDVEGASPLETLAKTCLTRTPCPAFHHSMRQPGDALVDAAHGVQANGVIFLLTPFCDPMAFDHVPMMNALENAGIPALTLSVEQHREPPEQLRTRVAAFAEMLRESATA